MGSVAVLLEGVGIYELCLTANDLCRATKKHVRQETLSLMTSHR